ncbi:MAG: birA 1 [Gammaproteobacteria bacterium]|jgi:BirA family biotin operon repressor/biotin-[acetyl-CoA-carboxylase] ligase|nr:birA 1 [Gammaproteobacteria bacterium]
MNMNTFFEPFSPEKIFNAINIEYRWRLAKLEIFDVIDSTNQYLLDRAKSGSSGWVCLAEQQTAGRGRRGRAWFSARGTSIMFSLLWRFSKELPSVSGLSIAVGVIVTQALKNFGVQTGIQLKWPNDILFNGRKLAGILLERRGENIIIGLGLNVNLSPLAIDINYIDLAEVMNQPIVDRSYLTGLLLNELLKNLPRYEVEGLSIFMDEWSQYDFLLGKEVVMHTSKKIIHGKAQGINEHGELLVVDDTQSMQCFCYGDVSVRCS